MTAYTVFVTPEALDDIRELPGHIRQRIRRAIHDLAAAPRPQRSKALDAVNIPGELRRIRLERWRIVYVVHDADRVVDIIAVRKRPPYDYGDLSALLERLS